MQTLPGLTECPQFSAAFLSPAPHLFTSKLVFLFFFLAGVGVELHACLQGRQELGLAVNPGGSRRWNFDNELKQSWETAARLLQQSDLMSVCDTPPPTTTTTTLYYYLTLFSTLTRLFYPVQLLIWTCRRCFEHLFCDPLPALTGISQHPSAGWGPRLGIIVSRISHQPLHLNLINKRVPAVWPVVAGEENRLCESEDDSYVKTG